MINVVGPEPVGDLEDGNNIMSVHVDDIVFYLNKNLENGTANSIKL